MTGILELARESALAFQVGAIIGTVIGLVFGAACATWFFHTHPEISPATIVAEWRAARSKGRAL